MRFSIRTLLTATSAIAVTLASLVYANQWLGDIYYSLLIAAIFLSCVAAVFRQGEPRAFWIGFAAAAGAYVGLTIVGRPGDTSRFYEYVQRGEIAGYTAELCTSRVLAYSYDFIAAQGGGSHDFQDKAEFERFFPYMFIGHSAFGLFCGWAAGSWTAWLYRKRAPQSSAR